MNYKELRLGIIHKLLGLCDLRFADPSSSLIILRVGGDFLFLFKKSLFESGSRPLVLPSNHEGPQPLYGG